MSGSRSSRCACAAFAAPFLEDRAIATDRHAGSERGAELHDLPDRADEAVADANRRLGPGAPEPRVGEQRRTARFKVWPLLARIAVIHPESEDLFLVGIRSRPEADANRIVLQITEIISF